MNTTTSTHHEGIEIRHTRADGTLVHGTQKGDGSAQVLKSHRFRWFRSIGVWGIQSSRDKEAQQWRINAAAEALRDAGFTVTVTINETQRRSIADVEADKNQRAEARADRYADRAANAANTSDDMWERADHISLGYNAQPILIGHHSERRHRRDIDRAANLYNKSITEHDKSQHYANRADASGNYQKYRTAIPVTLRRIETYQAEQRKWQRERQHTTNCSPWQERCDREIQELTEKIDYWKQHIADTTAANTNLKVWGPGDFNVGDFAQIGRTWHEVIRVNTKSLTVASRYSGFGGAYRATGDRYDQGRVPYHEITGQASRQHIDQKHPPEREIP